MLIPSLQTSLSSPSLQTRSTKLTNGLFEVINTNLIKAVYEVNSTI